ncbi:MAG TPA: osmotically inducible protein OsmC [Cytophagales bacterium]|nr:osmotically inducible protein OsmC [Cytophagales bacterium]
MKIEIKRINNATHLEATNEAGNKLFMDGSPAIGGQDLAFRPMQVLLTSLGGCSTMDVISILNKQKQDLRHIEISLDGEREAGVEPSLFRDIHVHFKLFGNVDPEKAKRAIDLSMTKYCSVAKTLESSAKISYDFEVLP